MQEPSRAEQLTFGTITVVAWILWVAFNFAIYRADAGTARLEQATADAMEALRRLP